MALRGMIWVGGWKRAPPLRAIASHADTGCRFDKLKAPSPPTGRAGGTFPPTGMNTRASNPEPHSRQMKHWEICNFATGPRPA